jgi:hypothetical protein
MATAAENIQTTINNVTAALAAWELQRTDYSDQGRSEAWSAHYNTLVQSLTNLLDLKRRMGGPFIVTSYGRSV